MVLVFFLAAVIWGIGHVMGVAHSRRWVLIGVLYLTVLSFHAVLPADNSLVLATGSSLAGWLVLGGVALLAILYRALLARLRQKANPPDQNAAPEGRQSRPFSDTELERYARHIVLREIGGAGQKRLKAARVLVVGAGGLGSPALLYLAAAGVGTIGVIDDDVVDNSNLQRQVIHPDENIGKPKVFSAAAAMQAQNPYVQIRPYNRRFSEDMAATLIADYDLVLDGCDNFDTRYLVNRTCAKLGVPLIAAALTQWEGQISLYDPAEDAPCYQCIFPQAPAADLAPACAEAGVVGPLPGVVGSMMALEAVKHIARAGEGLRGQLMIYDALYADTRKISLKPRADCPVCGKVTA